MQSSKITFNKYGEKGKNGVIELKTKKYLEETDEIYMKVEKDYTEKINKEMEFKAQEESKLSKEELEERRIKREQLIEERRKLIEEKKKEIEIRKKELEEKKRNN